MMDYSGKNFTGRTFVDAKDMDCLTIERTVFSQESWRDVFPPDVKNLTLVNCFLDNVEIPPGVTLIDCQPGRWFEVQNDGNDWEMDEIGPLNILNSDILYKYGLPIPSPSEIPDKPVEKFIDYFDTARNVRAK